MDDDDTPKFDFIFDAIANELPDIKFVAVDEDNQIVSELVLTNTMPVCVACGSDDTDQAFQDPRFMDGQTLCEFCYVPRLIEWERINK